VVFLKLTFGKMSQGYNHPATIPSWLSVIGLLSLLHGARNSELTTL
jgi:hypothetical protein